MTGRLPAAPLAYSAAMRLTDILKPENIKLPLAATDKQSAIEELVDLLASHGEVENADHVRKAVLEREATRTTGIGDGVAIPHGKTDGVTHLVMAVGRAGEPVDFQAIDAKPVQLIWLLSSPPDKTGPHITALARISKIMANVAVRKKLIAAKSGREIYDLIVEQDELL